MCIKKLFYFILIMLLISSCKPTSSQTVTGVFNKILEPVSIEVTPDQELGEMITTDEETAVTIKISNNSSDEIRNINLTIDTSENLINFKPELDGTIKSPGFTGDCLATLAPGKECSFKLVLVPRKQGEFNIKAAVSYLNKIEQQTKNLQFHLISGEPASVVFTNNSANYDLGIVEQTEVIERFSEIEIKNAGGLPARNFLINFNDDSAYIFSKPYKLVSHNCPSVLYMGQKCKVKISYTPRNNNYTDLEDINTSTVQFNYTNDPKGTAAQLVAYFTFVSSTIEAKFRPNFPTIDFKNEGVSITTGNKKTNAIRLTNNGYREGILKAVIFRKKAPDSTHKGIIAAICVKSSNDMLDCSKKRMSDFPNLFTSSEIAKEVIDTGFTECTSNCTNSTIYDFPFLIKDDSNCFENEIVSANLSDATHSPSCIFKITYWPSTQFTAADRALHDFNDSTIDFKYDSRWKGQVNLTEKYARFQNQVDYKEKARIKIAKVEIDGDPIDSITTNYITHYNDNYEQIDIGRLAKLSKTSSSKYIVSIYLANIGEETFKLLNLKDGAAAPFIADLNDLLVGIDLNLFYKGLVQSNCESLAHSTYNIATDSWDIACQISFELHPNQQTATIQKTASQLEDELMFDTIITAPTLKKIKTFHLNYTDGTNFDDDGTPITSRNFQADLKSLLIAKGKLSIANNSIDFGTMVTGDKKVINLKLSNIGTGPITAIQYRYDSINAPNDFSLDIGNNLLGADKVLSIDNYITKCATGLNTQSASEEYCPITGSGVNYGLISILNSKSFPYKITRYIDNGENIASKTGDAINTLDCADLIIRHKDSNGGITIPFSAPSGKSLTDYMLPEDKSCYLRIEAKLPLVSTVLDTSKTLTEEYKRYWIKNPDQAEDNWQKKAPTISPITIKFNYWDGDDNNDDRPKSIANFGYQSSTFPSFQLKSTFKTPPNIGISDIVPSNSGIVFRPVINYQSVNTLISGAPYYYAYPYYSKLNTFSIPANPNSDSDLSNNIFTVKRLEKGIAASSNLSSYAVRDTELVNYYKNLEGGAYFSSSNNDHFNYFLGAFQKGVDHFATISFKNFGGATPTKFKLVDLNDPDKSYFSIIKFKNSGYTLGTELTNFSNVDMVVKVNLPAFRANAYNSCYLLSYYTTYTKSLSDVESQYKFCLIAKAINAPLLKFEYQNWDVSYDNSAKNFTESITNPTAWTSLISPVNQIDNTKDEFGNSITGKAVTDPDRGISFAAMSSQSDCKDSGKYNCNYDLKKIKITNIGNASLTKLDVEIMNANLTVPTALTLSIQDDITNTNTICSKNDGSYFSGINDKIVLCKSDLNSCQNLSVNGSCTVRAFYPPVTIAATMQSGPRFNFSYPVDGATNKYTYTNQYIPINYQGLSVTKPNVEGMFRIGVETPSFSNGIALRSGSSPNYNYATKDSNNPYSAIANWSNPSATSNSNDGNSWWAIDLGAYVGDTIGSAKTQPYVISSGSASQIVYLNLTNNTSNKISFLAANNDPEANQVKQASEKTSGWYQVYPPYNINTLAFETYADKEGRSRAKFYASIGCFYGNSTKTSTDVPNNTKGFDSAFDVSTTAKTCQLKGIFAGDFAYYNCNNSLGTKNISIGGNIDSTNCNPYAFKIPYYSYKRTSKSDFAFFFKGFIESNRSQTTNYFTNISTKYISSTKASITLNLPSGISTLDGSLGSISKFRIYWTKSFGTTTLQSPEVFKIGPNDTTFKNNVNWLDVSSSTSTVTLESAGCTSTTLCKTEPNTYYYIKIMAIRNISGTNSNYITGTNTTYLSDPKVKILTVATPGATTYYADSINNGSTLLKVMGDRVPIGATNVKYSVATSACTNNTMIVNGYTNPQTKSLIDIDNWKFIYKMSQDFTTYDSNNGYNTYDIGQVPHWIYESTATNIKTANSLMKFNGSLISTSSVFNDWSNQQAVNNSYNMTYNRINSSGTFLLNKIAGGDGDTLIYGMNYWDANYPNGRARCKVDLKCPFANKTTYYLKDTTNCIVSPSN